jgi:hypothetical protein
MRIFVRSFSASGGRKEDASSSPLDIASYKLATDAAARPRRLSDWMHECVFAVHM